MAWAPPSRSPGHFSAHGDDNPEACHEADSAVPHVPLELPKHFPPVGSHHTHFWSQCSPSAAPSLAGPLLTREGLCVDKPLTLICLRLEWGFSKGTPEKQAQQGLRLSRCLESSPSGTAGWGSRWTGCADLCLWTLWRLCPGYGIHQPFQCKLVASARGPVVVRACLSSGFGCWTCCCVTLTHYNLPPRCPHLCMGDPRAGAEFPSRTAFCAQHRALNKGDRPRALLIADLEWEQKRLPAPAFARAG
ncbi:uncharacterized protein LOC131424448 [Marmota monax]|uniref:uncharacterized protein LOC131424448 n=1 Tax=Marmota monax TaxID=9995 RepID=UPI0026ECF115|nr:uncharacterized protein LOC131424448 [Marmota monax]